MTLNIANGIELPDDILTQSTGVLAKKGAGKTNLGVVLAEETFAAGVPVVVVDPKGDWYGIRSGANGSPKGGLPIPVFGGLHGDIPLEPTAGTYIAELVRDRGLSVILDVSEFSLADRRRFLTAFIDRLYRLDVRDPMLLMLEEAHEYIPQAVHGPDATMLSVFERIVKLGRWKGIGIVMMTQRSASLNKNVLTQIDNLFMLRTGSPQDKAAVQAWVADHGDAKEVIASLPGLAIGEFWLWTPGNTERPLVRAKARMRRTYDAGATPRVGETPRPPATLADVDLAKIASAMADTIEKVKADDPKHLRAELIARDLRIAELERQLTEAIATQPAPVVEHVEVPVLTDEDRQFLSNQANLLHQACLDLLRAGARDIDEAAKRLQALAGTASTPTVLVPAEPRPARATPADADRGPTSDGAITLGKAERSILAVLATHGTLRAQQVSLLSGYSVKSSSFANALGKLRSAGYAVGGKDAISVTDTGKDALGSFHPLPAGRDLIEHWLGNLGKAERTILTVLIDAYPNPLTNEEISDLTGYSTSSSSFANALGRIRSLQLATGGRDANYAAEVLGEAAR